MTFNAKYLFSLIDEIDKQKKALMYEFYEYIKYSNLKNNEEYLRNITPQYYKDTHDNKDYYDLFFEITANLDFKSTFTLKDAISVYLIVIKNVDRDKNILEKIF